MKRIKKLVTLLIASSLLVGMSLTSYACTPPISIDMPDIPDLSNAELSDETKEMIRNGVDAWFESDRDMKEKESRSTTLTVVKNEIVSGNRHIKVEWEEVEDAKGYIIEISNNEDFENSVSELITDTGYTFSAVSGAEKETYYLRVRPRFETSRTDDGFCYGQWSNVVIAEYQDKVIDKPVEADIKWLPKLDKSVWERLSKIDWNKWYEKR